MEYQIKLTLRELTTLAAERLIEQGKLKDGHTNADWRFNYLSLIDSYIVFSQED